MRDVGGPGRERRLGHQTLLQRQVHRFGRLVRLAAQPGYRGARRGQDHTCPRPVAFALRQHRNDAGLRHGHQQVEALTLRQREAPRRDRPHRVAIHRQHRGGSGAQVDPEGCRSRPIDQAQANPPGTLGAHQQRVIQRAVVGEIGVVIDVVEIHRLRMPRHGWRRCSGTGHAGHGHAGVRHAGHSRPAAGELRQHLGGVAEGEIVQQHGHLLHVEAQILGRAHHQRRGQQRLFLQTVMRMHPVGARARREVVTLPAAGGDQGAAGFDHAVLDVRGRLAVPVHHRRLAGPVYQIHRKALARFEHKAGGAVRLTQPEHRGCPAAHVEAASLDDQGHPGGGRGGPRGDGQDGLKAAGGSDRERGRQEPAPVGRSQHRTLPFV